MNLNFTRIIVFLVTIIPWVNYSSFSQGRNGNSIPVYANMEKGDSTWIAVDDLFRELRKSINTTFQPVPANAFKGQGIFIGTTRLAKKLNIAVPAKLDTYGPEGIYIKGNENSVLIIGNTQYALQEAVFIYLEKLGFRYLLPGELWEEIPVLRSIYKKAEVLTEPDFDNRTIANGHGYRNSKKIESEFKAWEKANYMGGSFPVRNGHSYDEIVLNNAALFREHPEYFAQPVPKGSLPPIPKFNVAHKDLVEFIAKDAVKRLDDFKITGQHTVMVSMEPSDGGGFCSTADCMAIGGPSDQAYYLANKAAREIRKKYPDSWVGLLAYNEHIVPTRLDLEPNIFVMVTNGFNRSRYNTEELLTLWGKKVKKTGVYEYLNVYEGSMDMPGQMHIGNTKYLARSIKNFYKAGATAYVGESTMGWVSKAVGNYTLARLLWNVDADVERIKEEFYAAAFGSVASYMKKMMDSWEGYPNKVPADNDIADWLKLTEDAYTNASNDKIRKRINQVKLYLHYIVLFRNLKQNPTKENLFSTLNFAWRNFETAAFATLPAMVSLGNYSGFKGMGLYDNPTQPWQDDSRPFTEQELVRVFREDMRTIRKTEGIKKFSTDKNFIRLTDIINLKSAQYPQSGTGTWGNTEYIIRITKKSPDNQIELTSGYAANPSVDRPVRLMLFKLEDTKKQSPVMQVTQIKKNQKERFSLAALAPGLYRLRVEDEQKMFVLKFSPGIPYSITLRPEEKLLTSTVAGYNIFYFYVPADVKRFQVTKTVSLMMESPLGRIINHENGAEGTFAVEVEKGEQGLWKIYKQSGLLYFDGIPPYLGTDPFNMLLPAYLKK